MAWKSRGEVLRDIAEERSTEGGTRKTIGILVAISALIGGFLGFPHNESLSLLIGGIAFGMGATLYVWGRRDYEKGTDLKMAVDKAEEMGILKPE